MVLATDVTRDKDRSLNRYLEEIKPYKRSSTRQERELAAKIKKGDIESRDRLVRANLRFVVKVAKEYQNCGLPLTDIISQGNMGLIRRLVKNP